MTQSSLSSPRLTEIENLFSANNVSVEELKCYIEINQGEPMAYTNRDDLDMEQVSDYIQDLAYSIAEAQEDLNALRDMLGC